jgi:hypothetical protein
MRLIPGKVNQNGPPSTSLGSRRVGRSVRRSLANARGSLAARRHQQPETGNPFRLAVCQDHWCQSVPVRERPRALRASSSFFKKLQSRVAPSYYLESLLCNAPTEAFSNKRSRARRRMYVRWCIPRGLFGKGCSRSGLPPSRVLIFREHLMNRLCGLSWGLSRCQAFELRELRVKDFLLAFLRTEVERRVAVASWDRQQIRHQRDDLPEIIGRLSEHALEL